MSRPATHIVFDLDGTLVQTRIASWEVFQGVQAEFGLGIDTEEKYFALLEGNLFAELRNACPDESTADAVATRFLERLDADYRPAIIPGMVDVVHALASRATLAVLSSNATSVIRRVLADNGLQYCFAHVFGGDVEHDKSAGLQRFIADAAQGVGRRCAAPYDEGSSPRYEDTVLVTDTTGDAAAALAAGVRVVGVSWGMHSPEDLLAAGAEFVAVWPQELISYLRPDGADAESCALAVGGGSSVASGASVSAPIAIAASTSPADALARAAAIRNSRRGVGAATPRTPPPTSGDSCGCAPPLPPVRSNAEVLAAMRATLR